MLPYGPPNQVYYISLPCGNIFFIIYTMQSININVSFMTCCFVRIYIATLSAICQGYKA